MDPPPAILVALSLRHRLEDARDAYALDPQGAAVNCLHQAAPRHAPDETPGGAAAFYHPASILACARLPLLERFGKEFARHERAGCPRNVKYAAELRREVAGLAVELAVNVEDPEDWWPTGALAALCEMYESAPGLGWRDAFPFPESAATEESQEDDDSPSGTLSRDGKEGERPSGPTEDVTELPCAQPPDSPRGTFAVPKRPREDVSPGAGALWGAVAEEQTTAELARADRSPKRSRSAPAAAIEWTPGMATESPLRPTESPVKPRGAGKSPRRIPFPAF